MHRVRKRIENEQELKAYHMKRITDWLRRTANSTRRCSRNRLLALQQEAYWYVKVYEMAKKTLKAEQPVDSFTTVQRAAMYHDTVEIIRKGGTVEGYTLLRSEKVAGNATVSLVVNLGDGWSLCRYVAG
ncbi:MAG: hypothetical protein ACK5NY_03425 [Burkholderiaceae bacterium]